MDIKNKNSSQKLRDIWLFTGLFVGFVLVFCYSSHFTDNLISEEKDKTIVLSDLVSVEDLLQHHDDKNIYLSVYDEATFKLPEETRDFFAKLQGQELSRLSFRESYVGIISAGVFVAEKRDSKALVSLTEGPRTIISGGLSAGSLSQLKIVSGDINCNARGLNVFIFDEPAKLIYAYNYDFFAQEKPLSKAHTYDYKISALDKITITLSEKDYNKLKRKRDAALESKVLLTDEKDLVSSSITFQDQQIKSEIRLKGDWTDHLIGDQWSFRVKLAKNKTLLGMRKFSLHQPKTRNYASEWLFHQVMKEAGILSLQYKFLHVHLKIQSPTKVISKDLGVYALEEFFDTYLIERNQRKLGMILKIDENPLWQERVNYTALDLDEQDLDYLKNFNYTEAKILPFGRTTITEDEGLSKQLEIASKLFRDFITGKKLISEVFDTGLIAKYNALSNLLGADHALIAHNCRVYYNPISGLLEPVAFDGNAGTKIYYPYAYLNGAEDPKYMAAYAAAIEEICQDNYLTKILSTPKLTEIVSLMEGNFTDYHWKENIFVHNKYILENFLNPVNALNVFFESYHKGTITLSVENHRKFPIKINNISTISGRIFGTPGSNNIVLGKSSEVIKFKLNKDYERLFVNKKKRKSGFNAIKDLEKIQLNFTVFGTREVLSSDILPWSKEGIAASDVILLKGKENPSDFEFLIVDKMKRTITCKSGSWVIKKPLIIPEGYTFLMLGDTKIDLIGAKAMIISFSPVKLIGRDDAPITITSSSRTGAGLLVLNTQDTSYVERCIFSKLSSAAKPGWVISGAVNFYKAPVKISHSSFTENRCEDALNIINGYFELDDITFEDIYSDAFDGDFVNGTITNSFFTNIGNDAIDVSNADINLENILIHKIGDKGLSAGENSKITASNCIIKYSEIGVASKDQSTINLSNSRLSDNKLAFTAFQKKSEYGPAHILTDSVEVSNNTYDFLIEENSSMTFNQQAIQTVKEVKERMYGIEFGKSSR